MQKLSWIAADWGTTRLRVWAIGHDQSILARAHSDKGMSALAPGFGIGSALYKPGDSAEQVGKVARAMVAEFNAAVQQVGSRD